MTGQIHLYTEALKNNTWGFAFPLLRMILFFRKPWLKQECKNYFDVNNRSKYPLWHEKSRCDAIDCADGNEKRQRIWSEELWSAKWKDQGKMYQDRHGHRCDIWFIDLWLFTDRHQGWMESNNELLSKTSIIDVNKYKCKLVNMLHNNPVSTWKTSHLIDLSFWKLFTKRHKILVPVYRLAMWIDVSILNKLISNMERK